MRALQQKKQFQEDLLTWYHEGKRDLPWRNTSNPYYIWVSEIMLQQTRVDTVIPYYERFISAYPTMEALAQAPEDELLKIWEGLGYYSRVRNLQAGVREVVERYNSQVPKDRKTIQSLKGIGPYTAGAILSIAYQIPEHAVDGNVMRVLSRIALIEEDITKPKSKKVFEEGVMALISEEDPSGFNQALMELGATICTPNPACLLCPVQSYCEAFDVGREKELPIKTKKVQAKKLPQIAYLIYTSSGKTYWAKRPTKGLLANLWMMPLVEQEPSLDLLAQFMQNYGVESENLQPLLQFSHVFSHRVWAIAGYAVKVAEGTVIEGYEVYSQEEAEQLPKPVPASKLWNAWKQQFQ